MEGYGENTVPHFEERFFLFLPFFVPLTTFESKLDLKGVERKAFELFSCGEGALSRNKMRSRSSSGGRFAFTFGSSGRFEPYRGTGLWCTEHRTSGDEGISYLEMLH